MQIFLRFENPIEKAAARSRDDDERLWDVPWWIGSYRFSKRSFQDPLICLLAGFRVQAALGLAEVCAFRLCISSVAWTAASTAVAR